MLALIYPPFTYGIVGEAVQYGFPFSGPPADAAARAKAGADSPMSDIIRCSIGTPILILELALVRGVYAALLATMLRRRLSSG